MSQIISLLLIVTCYKCYVLELLITLLSGDYQFALSASVS